MTSTSITVKLIDYLKTSAPALSLLRIRKLKPALFSKKSKSLHPAYPKNIIIDPVNSCNLRCPLCPTGLRELNYTPTVMTFDTFKLILKQIPSAKHVCLFNWGEPFLNPSILEMITYASQKQVRVTIHTNFSLNKDERFFQRILESDLDTLVISLDGCSAESYSQYRIGGDFDLVLANLKKLTDLKQKYRRKKPLLIWQFIVNKFNEHEINSAKKLARSLGVVFQTSLMGLSDDLPGFQFNHSIEERKEHWLPKIKKYRRCSYRGEYRLPLMNSICTQLFETVVVNPDGKVFPCCWITDEKQAFGDLTQQSFKDIWYNEKYLSARGLFINHNHSVPAEKTICTVCNNFRKVDEV